MMKPAGRRAIFADREGCLDMPAYRSQGSRAIIESRHWTISQRPLNAALHRLMMHPQSATHREEGWVFPVSQQNPRPLDPARRLRSRLRYRKQPRQILSSNRQLNRLPPCCHDLRPPPRIEAQGTSHDGLRESRPNDQFHGNDELGTTRARHEDNGFLCGAVPGECPVTDTRYALQPVRDAIALDLDRRTDDLGHHRCRRRSPARDAR